MTRGRSPTLAPDDSTSACRARLDRVDGHLVGAPASLQVLDRVGDEALLAEQPEQRDDHEQRREQRHDEVVRHRRAPVGHLVAWNIRTRAWRRPSDERSPGIPREAASLAAPPSRDLRGRPGTRRRAPCGRGAPRAAARRRPAAVRARVLAQQLERLALVDAVALHEDRPWRARSIARRSRALSSWSTCSVQAAPSSPCRRSATSIAPCTSSRESRRARERVDPARAAHARRSRPSPLDERDDRAARVRADLVDEVERVLVVAWTTTTERSGSSSAMSSAARRTVGRVATSRRGRARRAARRCAAAPPRPRRRRGPSALRRGASRPVVTVSIMTPRYRSSGGRPARAPRSVVRAPAPGASPREADAGTTCGERRRRDRSGRPRIASCSSGSSARRQRGARAARRALPAARPPARPPLPARRRAARRPRAGRVARPHQGDRPLRPRARGRVLQLRGPDDPRRAQAPLPRPHVVGPRPARPAGADAEGRQGRRELSRGPAPPAAVAEIAEAVGADEEQVLEALEAGGAYRATSLRRAALGDEDEATASPTRSASTRTASASPRTARRSSGSWRRSRRASARCCACASTEDLTQAEIGDAHRRLADAGLARSSARRSRACAAARRRRRRRRPARSRRT